MLRATRRGLPVAAASVQYRRSSAPGFVEKYKGDSHGKDVILASLRRMAKVAAIEENAVRIGKEALELLRWSEQEYGGKIPKEWYEQAMELVTRIPDTAAPMVVLNLAMKAGEGHASLFERAMSHAVKHSGTKDLHNLYLLAAKAHVKASAGMFTCLIGDCSSRGDTDSALFWWKEAQHMSVVQDVSKLAFISCFHSEQEVLRLLKHHVPSYAQKQACLLLLLMRADDMASVDKYLAMYPPTAYTPATWYKTVLYTFAKRKDLDMLVAKYSRLTRGIKPSPELQKFYMEAVACCALFQCAPSLQGLNLTSSASRIAKKALEIMAPFDSNLLPWYLNSANILLHALTGTLLDPGKETHRSSREATPFITVTFIRAAQLLSRPDVVTALKQQLKPPVVPRYTYYSLRYQYCGWLGHHPESTSSYQDAVRTAKAAGIARRTDKRSDFMGEKVNTVVPPAPVVDHEPPGVDSSETLVVPPSGATKHFVAPQPPNKKRYPPEAETFLKKLTVRRMEGKLLPFYSRWVTLSVQNPVLSKVVLSEYSADRKAGIVGQDLTLYTAIVQMSWKSDDFVGFRYSSLESLKHFSPDDRMVVTVLHGCAHAIRQTGSHEWAELAFATWHAHRSVKGFRLYTRLMEVISLCGDVKKAEQYIVQAPKVPSLGSKLCPYLVEHFEKTYEVSGMGHAATVRRMQALMQRT